MNIQKFTIKLLPFLICALGLFAVQENVQAQTCTANTTWVLNPPPVNGEYEAGQIVEICSTITGFTDSGAGGPWLHGITLQLPAAWDLSNIISTQAPATQCGASGTWGFYTSILSTGNVQPPNFGVYGPGFYFETGQGNAGVVDNNPGNNWGNICGSGSWTWCVTIQLDADCGGAGNPFDNVSIVPEVFLSGDGITGGFSGFCPNPPNCPASACDQSPNFTQAPNISISLNCCDGEPGVSPGVVDICNTGSFNMYSLLGPPVQNDGTWTLPSGTVTTDNNFTFDPLTSDPGDYVYSVVGSDGCIRTSTITMQFINLGSPMPSLTLCSPTTTTSIQTLYSSLPFPDPTYGGTWTDPVGTILPGSGPLDIATSPPGVYTYNFIDVNSCPTVLTTTVAIGTGGGGGGIDAAIDVCTIDPPFIPLNSLGGNPLIGPSSSWVYLDENGNFLLAWPSGPSNLIIDPSNYNNSVGNPLSMVSGSLLYVSTTPPCTPVTNILDITAFPPTNAGEFAAPSLCVDGPPVLLESLLGGTPDLGLTWTDLNDPAATFPGNMIDPGDYPPNTVLLLLYSGGLPGTNCFSTSLLELTIAPADANAGDPNTITVCAADPAFCMTDFLPNAQPGGVWTNSGGTVIDGCTFFPATMPAGTYTYTITTSCDSDSQNLVINVTNPSNAGTSGTLNICSNDTNIPLSNGLTGTVDAGGQWTLGGTPVGPTVNGGSVTNGAVYTYTVGTGNCAATSTVTINLQQAPFAGTAVATAPSYCSNDPSISLFTLLATPPSATTGTWTGPGAFTGTNLNPAVHVSGTYTYTLTSANCGSDTESINIVIEALPNAGTNATVNVCPNAVATTNLFAALGGATAGGTWISVPAGGPTNGTFTPGDPAGAYVYQVTSPSGNCTSQATITVQYNTLPNPGTGGAITVCAGQPAFPLISQMPGGPSPGGVWLNPGGTFFGIANVSFNPAVHPSGNYTYQLAAGGCPIVTAVLNVTVIPNADAGNDATVTLCETLGTIDLTSYLGGTPNAGGTWSVTNPFDISTLGGTTQTFTYTVDNGTCSDVATLTLNVESQPNAGGNGTLTFCSTDPCFDLSTGITGAFDAGGVWTNSGGTVVTNNQCPNTMGTGGVYTYTADGGSCADATSTVTVNVVPEIETSNLSVNCQASQLFYVVSFDISGGTAPYSVNGTGIVGNSFTSAPVAVGSPYSFAISDNSVCGNVTVSGASPVCTCPADVSFVGGDQDICAGSTATLSFDLTGTGPFEVVINDGTNDITIPGLNVGGTTTVSPVANTTYTLVSVQDINCLSTATGSLSVNVETPPNAGSDVAEELCAAPGTINLNTLLAANADAGGTFTPANPIPNTPASSGVYTYTVSGTVCPDDQAQYDIDIFAPITATSAVATCIAAQTGYTVEIVLSGGNGVYSVDGTPIAGNTFNSAVIPVGTNYSFVVSDSGPCANITVANDSPNCTCPATATLSGTDATICLGGNSPLTIDLVGAGPFDVEYTANGVPQTLAGITNPHTLNVSPSVNTTYVLTSVNDQNCAGSASGSVTISVETPPNAGSDVAEEICAAPGSINLNTLLAANADAGGTFTPANPVPNTPASSGIYTYTVTGSACPDDQAQYDIDIFAPINATSAVATCNAAQTAYEVEIVLSGGNGTYFVDGTPVVGNTFISALIPAGTNYSFVISDSGPCGDITVANNAPNCSCPATASLIGTNETICLGGSSALSINLVGAGPFDVEYTANGVPQTLTGITNPHTLNVSPSVNTTYVLTSVNDQNCAGSASGSVTISVETPPNAGSDVTEELCAAPGSINLNTLLAANADAGGTFTPVNPIPNTPASSGIYTYTVTGSVCPDDQAQYDINIFAPITATSTVATCNAAQTSYTVEIVLSGGNGSYSVDGTAIAGNTFNSAPITVGTNYSFIISDSGPCADITVANNAPNCSCPATATLVGANETICLGGSSAMTINLVGAGPFDVEYTANGAPQSLVGITNPHTLNVSPSVNTTYVLTSVNDQNCAGSASGSVTISVETPPNAGSDVVEELCAAPGNINLNTILAADADAGGTFTPANPIPNTPASSGIYTYTVTGIACPSDQAQYDITIFPQITTTGVTATCNGAQTQYTVEFTINGGNGSYLVDGVPIPGNTFTSAPIATGTNYSFTISDTGPCAAIILSNSAPNCSCLATASLTGGAQSICAGESVNLPVDLVGTGPWTVTYSDGVTTFPAVVLNAGESIPVSPPSTATYSLVSVSDANCSGSVSGSITVNVDNPLNAGSDVNTSVCGGVGNLNLITLLSGDAAPGGNFFDSNNVQVPGNSIPNNSASSGTYTYRVGGNSCPADEALYTIDIDSQISISGLTSTCNLTQTQYEVSFSITGGSGTYFVDGNPVTGNSFTSALINIGSGYNFSITDDGPCGELVFGGDAPTCDCLATGSITGSGNVCQGSCATITFSLSGVPPFSVVYLNTNDPTNPVFLDNLFNNQTIQVCPGVNSTYTLLSVSDANCTGTVTGNDVDINVHPPVVVSNVTETCSATGETYTVSFSVTGGVAPVTITPAGGTFNAGTGTYTSAPINNGQAYNFTVGNAGACPNITVSGQETCPCITDAGSLQNATLQACVNGSVSVIPNGDQVLDGNDAFQFVLHNGSSTELGAILLVSDDGTFAYNSAIQTGVVYYISAIAGNADAQGKVNINDPCLSVSNGISVIFDPLPLALFTSGASVCAGQSASLVINFGGTGPWTFSYNLDGGAALGPITSTTNSYTLDVNQVGTYTITQVSDALCSGPSTSQAVVTNFPIPTASIGGNGMVCANSGDGPEVSFTGNGPWTFTYSIDGAIQTAISTSNNPYTIAASSEGNYALTSLNDANCTGTVSGNIDVSFLELPTAQISGGGTVCAGTSATFTLELTGVGPWTVQYTADGVTQPPLFTSESPYIFESSVSGVYNAASVTDQNCTGPGTAGSAALVVNPQPSGEIVASSSLVCFGQNLTLTFEMEGTPPFDLTYAINGDTLQANGIDLIHTINLNPDQPIIAEMISVRDGSNPACSATLSNSIFIQVSDLPNAPVLVDDSICSGSGPVSIGVAGAPGLSYKWSPTTGLSNPNIANPTATLINAGLSPRVFTYVLTASNEVCFASDTVNITVHPAPRARFIFSPDPALSEDPTVLFLNRTIGSDNLLYFWNFAGLGSSTKENPEYKFPEGRRGEYNVTLTTIDPITSCSDSYSDMITVKRELLVYVPNAFTPDGDGKNDLWGPVLTNVDPGEFRLTVFDRTGKVVFETTDIKQKWNGGLMNGSYYLESAVYIWKMEGKELGALEEFEMNGIVTLVR